MTVAPPPGAPVLSRRTRLLPALLGLTAISVFGIVFVMGSAEEDARELVFSEADRAALTDGLRLVRPSIAGRTQRGEPYVIRAAWALPDGPNPENVVLDTVRGGMTLADGRDARLASAAGTLFPNDERIRLTGAVEGTTSDGYALRSEIVVIDGASSRLWTEAPVEGVGPRGEIEANRMEAVDEGDMIVRFEGNVRMVIWPATDEQALDGGEGE